MYVQSIVYFALCLMQILIPTPYESKIFIAIALGFMNVIGLLEAKHSK